MVRPDYLVLRGRWSAWRDCWPKSERWVSPILTVAFPMGLSAREAQILDLVARGLSNREIGEGLSISEHTAASHIRSILRKTDCANRTEAASYAHRHGRLGLSVAKCRRAGEVHI